MKINKYKKRLYNRRHYLKLKTKQVKMFEPYKVKILEGSNFLKPKGGSGGKIGKGEYKKLLKTFKTFKKADDYNFTEQVFKKVKSKKIRKLKKSFQKMSDEFVAKVRKGGEFSRSYKIKRKDLGSKMKKKERSRKQYKKGIRYKIRKLFTLKTYFKITQSALNLAQMELSKKYDDEMMAIIIKGIQGNTEIWDKIRKGLIDYNDIKPYLKKTKESFFSKLLKFLLS